MALVECEECGAQVSDRATACPNCGCPIERARDELPPMAVPAEADLGSPTDDEHDSDPDERVPEQGRRRPRVGASRPGRRRRRPRDAAPDDKQEDQTKVAAGCLGCVGLIVVLAFLGNLVPDAQPEVGPAGPKPQSSAWDGSVPEVQQYLERTMKDSDSLEILDASPVKEITHEGETYWGVRYRYKGKNSFGAYVTDEHVFLIRDGRVVRVVPYRGD